MRALGLVIGALLLVACGGEPEDSHEQPPPETTYQGIIPASHCPAGSMPSVATSECVPVGTGACADGFSAAADGWGCQAVLPEACADGERAALGSAQCVPVDDCSAPFPPAGAHAVVHDSAELDAALASAPAGAVIALESGIYQPLTLTRSVSLVGRCAKDVVFRGPALRGIYMQTDLQVELRSLTVEGCQGGVVASYGPKLTVKNVILADNQLAVVVGEASATIEDSLIDYDEQLLAGAPDQPVVALNAQIGGVIGATRVEVRGVKAAIAAADPGTKVSFVDSVAQFVGPTGQLVSAHGGADVSIERSLLSTRASRLITAARQLPVYTSEQPPAHVLVKDSVLSQTGANEEQSLVLVSDGASFELEGTTVVNQSYYALMVGESSAELRNSVIRSDPTFDIFRAGAFVTQAGELTLYDTAVLGSFQNALSAGHPGTRLELHRSLVYGTEFRGPGPNADLGGSGIGVAAGKDSQLVVADSALVGNAHYSLFVDGSSHSDIQRTLIDDTKPTPSGELGLGVLISSGAELAMRDSILRDNRGAALAASEGTGSVSSTAFLQNEVVVHLFGTSLVDEAGVHGLGAPLVFDKNAYFENASYLREGPLVLPPTSN